MAAALEHLERTMVQHALTVCHGRIEDTARLLGLSRKGLYLKRQRFGLDRFEPHRAERLTRHTPREGGRHFRPAVLLTRFRC